MMSDEQIVALYWERDEQAIRETTQKYGDLCLSIARNILHNECDAEECTNDTYLKVWNSIPPATPKSLKVFVYRIVRNIALNRMVYNHRQKRDVSQIVMLSEIESDLPDEVLIAEEDPILGQMISDFLREEKEHIRKVFVRRYFYSESINQIAERYGYTESKVTSMLFHTRKKLRKYLNERGVST